jgi:hypothetical protein
MGEGSARYVKYETLLHTLIIIVREVGKCKTLPQPDGPPEDEHCTASAMTAK